MTNPLGVSSPIIYFFFTWMTNLQAYQMFPTAMTSLRHATRKPPPVGRHHPPSPSLISLLDALSEALSQFLVDYEVDPVRFCGPTPLHSFHFYQANLFPFRTPDQSLSSNTLKITQFWCFRAVLYIVGWEPRVCCDSLIPLRS